LCTLGRQRHGCAFLHLICAQQLHSLTVPEPPDWCAEAQRFDHHQRGFEEVFGHGEAVCATLRTQLHADKRSRIVLRRSRLKLGAFPPWNTGFSTKLSSAGLVYKHFGRDIVAAQLGQAPDSPDVDTVYLAVYKHFMEAIDGIDNGGERVTGAQLAAELRFQQMALAVLVAASARVSLLSSCCCSRQCTQ
jgi:Uncharacterised protein family (UPF0160)